jgi:hypothetical protein
VSREAREGEQVEAAAWKSTNLHEKERYQDSASHRRLSQEKQELSLSSQVLGKCSPEK